MTTKDAEPKVLTETEIAPLPYDVSVCINHCCKRHGCKYSKVTCVVTAGKYAQLYPCEFCASIASIERRQQELAEELAWSHELETSGVPIHDYGNAYDY
jgi:hypothetical protein